MKEINVKGVLPAAVLPMTADYEPDYAAYARYLEWLIGEKAVAFAINMDTGEGPQLTSAERQKAAEVAVETAGGRVGVVAGVMGATTRDAVQMAKIYQQAGVDGLVIFPNAGFRNEPLNPRIPYEYHKAIADETDMPMILFQLAPVFGGVNFTREAMLHLLEIPQVVALKEASFDAQYYAYTVETVKLSARHVTILCGNDRFITECFMLGAEGALLGFCAIGCKLVAEMLEKFLRGDYKEAVEMRGVVQGFANVIYKDPMLDYRARCKVGLAHLGVLDFSQTYVRPPLLQVGQEESKEIASALISAKMLNLEKQT